jgi:ElaB/YqjD/DUF883 family membrane-anchored ribosome-binding protein
MELSNAVITNFNDVVADTEALLKATANQGGQQMAELRAKAEESLRVVKARMAEAQAVLLARTRAAARATDAYVHENPWRSIGVSAAVGLVIGLLVRRR